MFSVLEVYPASYSMKAIELCPYVQAKASGPSWAPFITYGMKMDTLHSELAFCLHVNKNTYLQTFQSGTQGGNFP